MSAGFLMWKWKGGDELQFTVPGRGWKKHRFVVDILRKI